MYPLSSLSSLSSNISYLLQQNPDFCTLKSPIEEIFQNNLVCLIPKTCLIVFHLNALSLLVQYFVWFYVGYHNIKCHFCFWATSALKLDLNLTPPRRAPNMLGVIAWNRIDEFSENFRGGGVISVPKKFVAVFSGGKNDEFSEKGGGSTPIRKILLQI